MSVADLEQKLERLFDSTRRGTEPDPRARERVRAALSGRLSGAQPPPSAWRWPTKGKALLAVSGGALLAIAAWRYGTYSRATPNGDAVHATSAAPIRPADAPGPTPAESATAAPVDAVQAPAPVAGASAKRSLRPAPLAQVAPAEQDSEVALMSALQLALRRGDAKSALAIADQHQRRFPHGALSMEREAGRAVARCPSLEGEQRAAVVADFSRRFPASPYLSKVEDACSR